MCRGCRKVVKTGWQVVRPWTFLQQRHIATRGYNITQSSAPEDGHMVARNMLSNYKKRNKEYKKRHLVGFSYLFVFLSSVLEAVNRFLGYVEDYQIGGRPEAVFLVSGNP